jgi:hypothetical protein
MKRIVMVGRCTGGGPFQIETGADNGTPAATRGWDRMGSQRQPLTTYRVEARRGTAWETLHSGDRYTALAFYNACIEAPRRVLEVTFDSAHRQLAYFHHEKILLYKTSDFYLILN